MRFLDLALEDDELVAEQGILGDQFSFAESEIGGGAQEEGRASGLGQTTEGLIQNRKEAGEQVGTEVDTEGHSAQISSQRAVDTGEEIVMWRPICDKLHVDEVFGKDREPQTLRDYLRRIGTEIGHVPVDTASILRDMDTPAQYRQELAEYLNRQPVEQAG